MDQEDLHLDKVGSEKRNFQRGWEYKVLIMMCYRREGVF